jgi:hypothetical protein
MFREQLQDREEEIIRLLDFMPKGFILIGGYAVSALSSHRFSVDCDVVIARKTSKRFRDMLKAEGYIRRRSAKVDKEYGGAVEMYVKTIKVGRITVDLFLNSITGRETGASWSYEHIRRNSIEAVLAGMRNSANVTVPTKELLIAMKIHSGRDADIRDIVMLCENADWNSVTRHIARGDIKILLNQLTKILSKIESEEFLSSLRATFELRQNIKPLISTCKRELSNLKETVKSTRS